MSIKQTSRILLLAVLFVTAGLISVLTISEPSYAATCGGRETAIISCDQSNKEATNLEDTGLWGVLVLTINILTAGVAVLAVAGFVYGGILYITSGGSPEQAKKARGVFANVIVGVIAYGGMYALLNFIIPGGVFN